MAMRDKRQLSGFRIYLTPVMFLIVNGLIVFLAAGSFGFWPAWVYLIGVFMIMIFMGVYLQKKAPGLMARRMQYEEKEPSQNTVFLRIFGPLLYIISYLTPGLDYRYHWSTVPSSLIIIANIMVFLGLTLIFFVFKTNSYAESIIQVENDQMVITTGPYTVVRHPMYVGLLLMFLFDALALGSYWALVPFLLCIPMLMSRAINEEKVLIRDLPGYREYCLKTRYRLLPFIW